MIIWVFLFVLKGEVCRYLLNQPLTDLDKKHSIKLCIGNGMRANIHKEFTERFNIKAVEIFGATEGLHLVVVTFSTNNQFTKKISI